MQPKYPPFLITPDTNMCKMAEIGMSESQDFSLFIKRRPDSAGFFKAPIFTPQNSSYKHGRENAIVIREKSPETMPKPSQMGYSRAK